MAFSEVRLSGVFSNLTDMMELLAREISNLEVEVEQFGIFDLGDSSQLIKTLQKIDLIAQRHHDIFTVLRAVNSDNVLLKTTLTLRLSDITRNLALQESRSVFSQGGQRGNALLEGKASDTSGDIDLF